MTFVVQTKVSEFATSVQLVAFPVTERSISVVVFCARSMKIAKTMFVGA
jgi:hypothetical protein